MSTFAEDILAATVRNTLTGARDVQSAGLASYYGDVGSTSSQDVVGRTTELTKFLDAASVARGSAKSLSDKIGSPGGHAAFVTEMDALGIQASFVNDILDVPGDTSPAGGSVSAFLESRGVAGDTVVKTVSATTARTVANTRHISLPAPPELLDSDSRIRRSREAMLEYARSILRT